VNEHSSKQYDADLETIRSRVLEMGGLVEAQIRRALEALSSGERAISDEVIANDHRINGMEVSLDGDCSQVIVKRQPAANDLRLILAITKIVTDLERIGDLAVNIAERALELNQEPPLKPYIDIPHMAREVSDMVHRALDSFVKRDAAEARAVLSADDAVDALNVQLFRELLTYMIEEPKNVTRALRITFIAKYLERVGDHATNIAQMVIFMSEGRDVRHPRLRAKNSAV